MNKDDLKPGQQFRADKSFTAQTRTNQPAIPVRSGTVFELGPDEDYIFQTKIYGQTVYVGASIIIASCTRLS